MFDDIIVIPNKTRAWTRIQIGSTSRRFWLHCDRHRISVGNLSSTNLPTPNRSARNSIHSVHQEKTLYLTFVCLTVTFLVCHLPRHSSLELGTCEKMSTFTIIPQYIYWNSKLSAPFVCFTYWFKLVYGLFEQINLHHTINSCPV